MSEETRFVHIQPEDKEFLILIVDFLLDDDNDAPNLKGDKMEPYMRSLSQKAKDTLTEEGMNITRMEYVVINTIQTLARMGAFIDLQQLYLEVRDGNKEAN